MSSYVAGSRFGVPPASTPGLATQLVPGSPKERRILLLGAVVKILLCPQGPKNAPRDTGLTSFEGFPGTPCGREVPSLSQTSMPGNVSSNKPLCESNNEAGAPRASLFRSGLARFPFEFVVVSTCSSHDSQASTDSRKNVPASHPLHLEETSQATPSHQPRIPTAPAKSCGKPQGST